MLTKMPSLSILLRILDGVISRKRRPVLKGLAHRGEEL